MNHKMIFYTMGQILRVEGVLLLLPMIVSFIYGDGTWMWFLIPAAGLGLLGSGLAFRRPKDTMIQAKEGLVIVGLAWILLSVFGAFPFFLSGEIPNFLDCLFETVSGFTTTGSTILTKVAGTELVGGLSMGMLFWRSFTQWVGGMGVLVFVLAILPRSDVRAMHILRAETTGYKPGKLVSKVRTTARILYGIYFALTVFEIIFLLCGGMNFYDSLVHAFTTAGTGGFSPYADGMMYFDSVYLEMVVTVFMFLFGVNFQLFYLCLLGNFAAVFKNEELRWYFGIVIAAILLIALNIMHQVGGFWTALRYASFNFVSVITTTGFLSADFAYWPLFSRCVLIFAMFVGACAGSTGGGVKVSRFAIGCKSIFADMRHMLRPRTVVQPRFEGKTLEKEDSAGVARYLLLWIILAVLSVAVVSLTTDSFEQAVSGVVTCIGNVGPGTTPDLTVTFAHLHWSAKAVFVFDMLAGRLELFPILMLFSPATWRRR